MRPRLAAAIAISALGCAADVAADPPADGRARLPAKTLAGPHETLDAACAAALDQSGAPARPCVATPLALPAGAPFSAVLLRSEDTSDPRFAGSGVFFLALGNEGAWFVTPTPLDRINGAAGHMYLPVITPAAAFAVTSASGDVRVLLRLVDATTKVCNVCEGPEREQRKPVQARALLLACGRSRASEPACTAVLETDERARATLAPDGTLAVSMPGAAAKRYEVVF